jgi:hypothetical protein
LRLDELYPYRDFPSVKDAMAGAERDLPLGTPVRWAESTGRTGGFISGLPGVGPGIADALPALVIWPRYPAGEEAVAESWTELRELLLAKLDWLVDLAANGPWPDSVTDRRAWSAEEIDAGHRRALAAIARLDEDRRLSP